MDALAALPMLYQKSTPTGASAVGISHDPGCCFSPTAFKKLRAKHKYKRRVRDEQKKLHNIDTMSRRDSNTFLVSILSEIGKKRLWRHFKNPSLH
jgi:hypothetical protein